MAEDRFVDDFEKVHGPYVLGELTVEERELERHLEGCSPCRRAGESLVDQLATSCSVSQAPSPISRSGC